jgi:hypothetical protein
MVTNIGFSSPFRLASKAVSLIFKEKAVWAIEILVKRHFDLSKKVSFS